MTHAWFFGRLIPMLTRELVDALRAHYFYDDVTAEEQAELSGLAVLLETCGEVSTRIAMRGTPLVGVECPESRVRCICGHLRSVHATGSPHACQGAQATVHPVAVCECRSFTAGEPAYLRPTDRPPPPEPHAR